MKELETTWTDKALIALTAIFGGTAAVGGFGCLLFVYSLPILFILVVMACLLRLAGFI